MSAEPGLAALARREIVALHAFFVDWFAAADPAPDFADCESAFAPDFVMVAPDGTLHERAAVVARLCRARLSRPPGFAIAIADTRVLWETTAAVLIAYVERQRSGAERSARRATALLTPAPASPRGMLWRALQETWMQAPSNNG